MTNLNRYNATQTEEAIERDYDTLRWLAAHPGPNPGARLAAERGYSRQRAKQLIDRARARLEKGT